MKYVNRPTYGQRPEQDSRQWALFRVIIFNVSSRFYSSSSEVQRNQRSPVWSSGFFKSPSHFVGCPPLILFPSAPVWANDARRSRRWIDIRGTCTSHLNQSLEIRSQAEVSQPRYTASNLRTANATLLPNADNPAYTLGPKEWWSSNIVLQGSQDSYLDNQTARMAVREVLPFKDRLTP